MTSAEPEDESSPLPIPDWQRRILDDRLANIEQNPNDEQTWEEAKADLWP